MIVSILLVVSMVYLIIGAIGINKMEGVLPKLLTSSMIDTVALIMLVSALILKLGFSKMSVKLTIVLLFVLLTNPVINHIITRAAHDDINDREEV